jgi:hemerythrin
MGFLTWTLENSVGIPRFDKHHQHLFELINSLHGEISGGRNDERTTETLDELARYGEEHFAEEESYMNCRGHKELDSHRRAHDAYRAKVREFQTRSRSADAVLTLEMVFFLGGWWTSHIEQTDKGYSPVHRKISVAAVSPSADEMQRGR